MTSKEIVNEQAVRDLMYQELIKYWGKTEEEAKELADTYYDDVIQEMNAAYGDAVRYVLESNGS